MASAQTMAQGFKERATKGGTPKRLWPSTDTRRSSATWARLRPRRSTSRSSSADSAVHSKLVLSLDQMATKSDEMGSMLATQLEKLKDLKVQVRSRRKRQGHPGARRAAERAREEWRQAYTLGLQLVMAKNLNVSVDAAALADTEHAEVAARAHAHDIHVAGGRSHIGIIYKKPFQTAAQKANAERMRKSRAAKRAAEAEGQ